jgi:hypothetical protein
VPVDIDVTGMPQYVDLIKRQESLDREKLTAIAKQHLAEVKWEILDEMGQPAEVIAEVAAKLPADLIVMVTHGRRGLARLIEGSIADKVLRSAPCPSWLSVRNKICRIGFAQEQDSHASSSRPRTPSAASAAPFFRSLAPECPERQHTQE